MARSIGLVAVVLSIWLAPLAHAAEDEVRAGNFRPTAQHEIVPKGSTLEVLWAEGDFTEGPAAAPSGEIYFTDIGNRILRFDPRTSKVEGYREPSGRANGLAFDPLGRLIACEGAWAGNRRISITEKDGTVRTLAEAFEGKRFNSPNDLAIDSKGNVFFTDPRYAGEEKRELDFEGVFRVTPEGKVTLATKAVEKPNGILVSPDGKTVYVSDSNSVTHGKRQLVSFVLRDDGTLTDKKVLYDFGLGRGIDGMTLDVDGNLYATAGKEELAGIYVFSPVGKPLAFLPLPGDPTNCEFGRGDDAKSLYITARAPRPQKEGMPRKYALYRTTLAKAGYHGGQVK